MDTIANLTKSQIKIGIFFTSGLDLSIQDFVRFGGLVFQDFPHDTKIIHALNF